MITGRVRKTGTSCVVTIPRKEMERLNIADGDLVGVEIRRATMSYELPPELEAAFKRSWEAHRETYRFLVEH
jgi:antitoxin component of MazEF toxin-antitoxin module